MAIVTDIERLREILRDASTVAVLGAHVDSWKAASYVPEYLLEVGYRLFPVNPRFVGRRLWGEPVVASLADIKEPVDLVDVFRRAEALPDHLDEILAMTPLPRVVWFQLGIRNEDVARQLSNAGIEVVQNRCTLADHRRWF